MLPVLARRFSVPSMFDIFDDFGLGFPSLDEPFVSDLEAWEDKEGVHVSLELPGYDKDRIEVTREGDVLTISASKEEVKNGKDRNYLTRSRHASQFSRSLTLPAGLRDDVDAEYHNGVLTITIQKKEEKRPKRIEVKQLPNSSETSKQSLA